MNNLISQDYLMHHGVKGMKWGVRHDPIRSGRSSRSYNNYKTKRATSKSNYKKWMKNGAIIAGGILAGVGAAYLIKSGKFSKLASIGKKYLSKNKTIGKVKGNEFVTTPLSKFKQGEVLTESTIAKKPKTSSLADEFMHTNSDLSVSNRDLKLLIEKRSFIANLNPVRRAKFVGDIGEGKFQNCTLNTTAMHMRKMGYDVKAGRSRTGYEMKDVSDWWIGPDGKRPTFQGVPGANANPGMFKWEYNKVPDAVSKMEKQMLSHGNASGDMHVYLEQGGGHSIAWEVKNGKLNIYDGQVRQSYNGLDDFFTKNPNYTPELTHYARFDNCKPNLNNMSRYGVIFNSSTKVKNKSERLSAIVNDPILLTEASAAGYGSYLGYIGYHYNSKKGKRKY